MTPPTIETRRLRLRPLDLRDTAPLNAIQADPEHMRFYPHPFTMGETLNWIERTRARYKLHGFGLLAVEDRATGEFLGNVGPMLQNVDGLDEVELGWSVTPKRARQGIATEAAFACRDWAFAELRVERVISLILPENAPSSAVATKLGMTVWKEAMWGQLEPRAHLVWRVNR